MHLLPQLRKLEKKYSKELVVIGVHSPKFFSERETANVRQAVLRYRIQHPVVNDRDSLVWQQYACRAWPTLMFLDPQGKIIGRHEGEISFDVLDRLMGEMVAEFDAGGLLDRTPLEYRREPGVEAALSFPGKLLAHAASRRLFVADSNHNRILVLSLEGEVLEVIGSGAEGLRDGDYREACFNHPQGLALEGPYLYVADTENHAIRRVDLSRRRVETLAGTGEQAPSLHGGGEARAVPLSSPWDLTLHQGKLYIAMAGMHQLWVLDLGSGRVHPFAGSGGEGLKDGPLRQAWLAQPSGITCDGERLFFADSEVSAVRCADLDPSGRVSTIVGQGLFVFGDVDGSGPQVRLQHPLGICYHEGVLYVADSYNNKIKRVFPRTRSAATYLGSGDPGHRDGPGEEALFYEPGGLSAAWGRLYIADTNNHALRVADLDTRRVSTLEIKGL